jgi:hypothetical protein
MLTACKAACRDWMLRTSRGLEIQISGYPGGQEVVERGAELVGLYDELWLCCHLFPIRSHPIYSFFWLRGEV